MASSAVKGLTIPIGADTQKFTKAMDDIKKDARTIAGDLKTVNENLKLDSSDTEKAADRMKLLQDAANNASKKVETYQKAINELNKKYSEGKISESDYKNALSELERGLESAKREQDLANAKVRDFNTAAGEAKQGAINFGDAIKAHVIADVITKGLSLVVDLAKSIAKHMAEAAKAIVNYGKEAISMAADYEDAVGYSEQVFKDYAETVQKWVTDNSVRLRMNISDLQAYVNNMGSLYRSFGLEEEKAAELAEGLIDRAADLKAATGKDLQDVLNSLTSVMTGGYRAGYQYGIVINEAAIKAEALSSGLVTLEVDTQKVTDAQIKMEKAAKKSAEAIQKYGEDSLEARDAQNQLEKATQELEDAMGGQALSLTQAQKEQAIYNLIMEQTSHLAGQSSREAGGYKSQLDALKTTFENLQITIGGKLLPVFTDLITQANDFFQSTEGQELLDAIVEGVETIAQKAQELINDGKITEWLDSLKEKIPAIAEAITNAASAVSELLPKIMDLTDKLLALFGIKSEAQLAKDAFKEVKDSVEDLAKSYNISTETMNKAINEFAIQNGISTREIFENWETYAPQISEFLDGLAHGYEADFDSALGTIQQFARDNGLSLSDVVDDWWMYEPKIESYAASLGEDYKNEFDNALGLIQQFAADNGVSLSDVVTNWSTYEPQVNQWMQTLGNDTRDMEQTYAEHINSLAPETQKAVNDVSATNLSPLENVLSRIKSWAQDVKNWIKSGMDEAATAQVSWGDELALNSDFVRMNNGASWTPFASGGPAKAGQMIRVNDDAGHRVEGFIPFTDGYVVNGNQVDKMVNNNNNSWANATINIYAVTYGADAAAVSKELGGALQQELRMIGGIA